VIGFWLGWGWSLQFWQQIVLGHGALVSVIPQAPAILGAEQHMADPPLPGHRHQLFPGQVQYIDLHAVACQAEALYLGQAMGMIAAFDQ
jgi:hypothetical protein